MFIAIVLFLVGLALIIKGGDVFVDASVWMSDVSGIPRAVIGATIVAFATTAPEYSVSTIAVMKGFTDLSIGNAVGSLSVNLGVAFALLAVFAPGQIRDRLFNTKGLLMILAAVLLWVFCLNGTVSVLEAVVLILIFAVSVFLNIRCARDDNESARKPTNFRDISINISKFILGAAAIVYGSSLMVDNGVIIAESLGISQAVIGLTIVAIGTSLPELVTSVTAVVKKQAALSIGNILGANLLDTTLILATGSFVSGGMLAVAKETLQIDLPVAVLLMFITVLPSVFTKRISRWQGLSLVAVYISYLVYLVVS